MQKFIELQEQLEKLNGEYDRFCELLEYEEVLLDKKLFLHIQSQANKLQPLISKYKEYCDIKHLVDEWNEHLDNANEDGELYKQELDEYESNLKLLQQKIVVAFNKLNGCYEKIRVQIVANKHEKAYAISELLKNAIVNFCKNNRIECGCSDNVIDISGFGVREIFSKLVASHVAENGKAKCQLFVLNVAEEYAFNEKDIEVTMCRSSGAGGQHINTTDSAVRATHIPTGIVAVCQDERSQMQNKKIAIERLKDKVDKYFSDKNMKDIDKNKKNQLEIMAKVVYEYDFNKQVIKGCFGERMLKQFSSGEIL